MSGTKPKFRPLQYLVSKSPTLLKTGWLASPVPGTSATWSLVTHGPPTLVAGTQTRLSSLTNLSPTFHLRAVRFSYRVSMVKAHRAAARRG